MTILRRTIAAAVLALSTAASVLTAATGTPAASATDGKTDPSVVQTPDEARLMTLARERKWNVRDLKRDVRRLERDAAEEEADLAAASAEARSAAVRLRATDRAIELLESQNDALRARVAAAERGAGVPAWAVIAPGLALVGVALLIRRRRSPAIEIPDTVPDDLVEGDRAGV